MYTEDNAVRQISGTASGLQYEQYMRLTEPSNAICVGGTPVTDVIELIRNIDVVPRQALESGKVTSTKGRYEPPIDLFDGIDAIIFNCLQDKHLNNFKASDLYYKYFGFLRIADEPLSEDDFSLFRVLGRGGFGLVNGCKKCTSGKLYAMKVNCCFLPVSSELVCLLTRSWISDALK